MPVDEADLALKLKTEIEAIPTEPPPDASALADALAKAIAEFLNEQIDAEVFESE